MVSYYIEHFEITINGEAQHQKTGRNAGVNKRPRVSVETVVLLSESKLDSSCIPSHGLELVGLC